MVQADQTVKRAALLVATLGAFLTPFMGSAVTLALPRIGQAFSMDAVLLGWVATAYLLAAAMFLVPFGKIADIHGRKRIFTYGVVTLTLASFLCAISTSGTLLICFRVLQGIGSAMIFSTGIAILTSVFPAGERGKALGINVAAVYLGLSLGPFLGGLLTQHLGWWEQRVEHPVLNMALFRGNTVFAFSNLAALINYSATFAVGFLMSLYLQYVRGLSPQSAGLVLVSQPIVQAVFSPFAGRLSDRVESRTVASAGMGFTVVGLVLLAGLDDDTSLRFIVASLMLLGFGFALFSSPNTNAIMSSVEKRFYGVASATLGTMRLIGQMFSMGIVMLIFSLIMGKVEIAPENYPSLLASAKLAFTIFAILCFGGIFASLARGKVR
jgi:MFS family permease